RSADALRRAARELRRRARAPRAGGARRLERPGQPVPVLWPGRVPARGEAATDRQPARTGVRRQDLAQAGAGRVQEGLDERLQAVRRRHERARRKLSSAAGVLRHNYSSEGAVPMNLRRFALAVVAAAGVATPFGVQAQQAPASDVPTFTKDIAPILQRSCQNCHRADGVAPMSLVTYEEVRPWARAIKQRTGIGPHAGVMPPWYM